jgi:hypothetical protein
MAFRSSRAEKDRVRHLLALDATAVMRRLADRRDEMVRIFAHQRDRRALVEPLRSTFDTVRFSDLAILSVPEQRVVHDFHEALDDLRWYLQYTVDMPGTLEQRLHHYLRTLAGTFEKLAQKLGTVPSEQLDVDMPAPAQPRRRVRALKGRRAAEKRR